MGEQLVCFKMHCPAHGCKYKALTRNVGLREKDFSRLRRNVAQHIYFKHADEDLSVEGFFSWEFVPIPPMVDVPSNVVQPQRRSRSRSPNRS